ncbi:hypothetical protein [Wolinella succinogenes]|uniref:BFD-like [2Fe-2S]-binding domain-containing protein n=1 Tax=Wolinella succinogenes (strain ATCC 29543 / DSM 1740 / CCUG 13145 / JCM 31913 / LMG 7466 / NCTC 11488 / FDC 602W) TaxID=273121 RepID=Q7MRF6_WOLSU|nr:hypothetical protein [Wolinella succinogenes]CAE10461.1 hypothetical protein WS1395 [Wolinella succinogenes]VEG80604.1 Uncharacterised protein [Wolinella succinogenes]
MFDPHHRVLDRIVCECGGKTTREAIVIFQNTSLPFRKAKKLVTGCDRVCCRKALEKLFDMSFYGEFDLDEIERLLG